MTDADLLEQLAAEIRRPRDVELELNHPGTVSMRVTIAGVPARDDLRLCDVADRRPKADRAWPPTDA